MKHPSLNGGRQGSKQNAMYERLEFVGDRVLGLIISEWLYELHANAAEGELAKRHTGLVNRTTLASIATEIKLAEHLKVAKSEWQPNATILADALEALIGALYLDGGIEVATRFVRTHWAKQINGQSEIVQEDPKSALQEWLQKRSAPLPVYQVVDSSGPAHDPHFVVEVIAGKFGTATGEGKSKREAEKAAATHLLQQLNQ